jgi:GDP/UDP-N,N'-diacetylbacillosamine 2-epimerase (hydrolysing)
MMEKKRKICVVSGSRADYDLLYPLLCELKDAPDIELQLVVTGMHLEKKFGATWRSIERDGFRISSRINIKLVQDTPVAISRATGAGIAGLAKEYEKLIPDIIVVLGDRFEIFAAAVAALICGIPLAHLHGGEATFGAFDEALRHSITKMSHLHFTATESYRRRVIQLGEDPQRVFCVGALGLDNIKREKLLGRAEVEDALKLRLKPHNLLVTFHPVTLEKGTAAGQVRALLAVLDGLESTQLIFTRTNADTYGKIINQDIEKYVNEHKDKAALFDCLGRRRYLSLMRHVDAVVGNSSSGIIEAPSFGIGTINIGDRQKGRDRPQSVIDCEPDTGSIKNAFSRLYSDEFQRIVKEVKNPYGQGDAAVKIRETLETYPLKGILKKEFYDLQFSY